MKDVVEKLLREKRARYLTKEYIIKKYNEDVYNKILKRTSYLPDSCNLQLRIYHILHGLYEPCKCLTCGKELYNNLHKFNIDVKEYLNVFCSNTCMRSYKFNFSGEPPKNIEFNKENITKYVKEKSIDKIKRNFFIMKEIQCYIYSIIGDDYKRMGDVEAIYFIKNNLSELPKCKITGEYLRYKGAGKYFKHSSLKASAKDKKTKDKRKRTSIELYGVENVSQNKRIKEKIMNTHFNRYNSHYCKSEEYKKRLKSGEIQRKALSDEKREIIKLQNYKRAWKTIQSFKDTIIPLFSFEDYEGCGYDKLYKWKCVQTGKEFEAWYNFGWVPKSPHIYTGSDTENIILKYLKRNNISFVKNYRKIIPPQEIDFYIPEYKIAIECNGLYWHSELFKDKKYHIQKYEKCKDKGIRLYQFFGDELLYSPQKIYSKLNSIFKINKYPIYARKCKVKRIDNTLKNNFLKKYHIQKSDNANICYGLFYKNNLVMVMTFSKPRVALGHHKYSDNTYELVRLCGNNSFYVIGGASKLLKHFENDYNPQKIITYSDIRYSDGDVYNKLGFSWIKQNPPSYFYTKNYMEKVHRFNFRKNILSKKMKKFDASKTEWENMKDNGWIRVWDCGTMVFEKMY